MDDQTVTPAETTDQLEGAKRAAAIADLYAFAAFLSRNPWAPLPYLTLQADLQRHAPDIWNGGAEGVAELRRIADALGEKPDESSNDRTSVDHRFGSVVYHVISWHKDGRPGEPDAREAELERLRAENAELRAARTDTEHYEKRGWTGGTPGTSGVECACGIGYDGFDSLAEASKFLAGHIAASVPPAGVLVVADGHVVHECCGKLDDAEHRNYCANYAPGLRPETLALVAQVEKALPSMQTPEFAVLAERLLSKQVCTSLPDDEATARVNAMPSGTSHGWQLSTEPENAPVPCADQPETHRHLVFDC